ncbi:hypothetical protein B0T14DRAFT_425653 [Immersiella caudata]|uniref:Rhodopsin domain-containing protein n=1 Tax=Immersiella caudata TaxID=314043 RepID=A0AA39WW79_9PEZI|nr:hypothetical protein B0T14DRAFT_425653 [Immersiella caudata]
MSSADGSFVPASPPPPGVTPDFVNGESIAYRLFVVAILFSVLSLLFLSSRLFTAASIQKKWHPDDTLIIVAWFIALANSVIAMVQTKYGLGKHMWEVSAMDFQEFMKIGMIGGLLTYNLATLFIKTSILSFYLRFSVDRAFRVAVYVVMVVTVGYTVPNAILVLYACRPMKAYWDFAAKATGQCVNLDAAFHTANTLNMLTDFAILLLPIWMLRPMQVPLFKKIGVALILMAGGFVCGISLMRMIMALLGIFNPDISFHYTGNLIWIVEMNFGIICACLPALRPFLKHYFPNLAFFDPQVEQRVVSSFRLSNRAAHFGRPSTTDGFDASDATTLPTAMGNKVLRTKPSAGSGSSEGDQEHGMRKMDEKTASHQTETSPSTLVPSYDARSVDSGV